MPDAKDQIIKGADQGKKTYSYDKTHDKNKPADLWFQESQEGLILFTIFYTQACRWSRCFSCNLPSKSSLDHIDYKSLITQIDHLFELPEVKNKAMEIKKFIVSNNGSVLDEETFSSTALMYLIAKVNLNLPNLEVLSLETRAEYADIEEMEFISRALKEGKTPTKLELAIGFESFDERIRNEVFHKGLSLKVFEEFVKRVAPYDFHIKCYFMQKPVPEISDEEAISDIQKAIDYLSGIAEKYNVSINMHLNPTFVAAGTPLEKAFLEGKYAPPKVIDVARAAIHGKGKKISIFLGLYDEGLAVEGGSFLRGDEGNLIERLEEFNKTQDYNVIESVLN